MKQYYKDYIKHQLSHGSGINVDFSNKCLLQCVFCMRQSPLGGKDKIKNSSDMPFEDFKKIIKKFRNIRLCGQISDPIYHPRFIEYLNYAVANKNEVQIHTTGTGKKIKFWKDVFSIHSFKKIKWIFGIDGTSQKTTNLHRIGQNFFSATRAMLLGSRSDHKIVWQFIPFKHNEHEILRALKTCERYGIELMLLKSSRFEFWDMDAIINNKRVIIDWIEPPNYSELFYNKNSKQHFQTIILNAT